MTFGRTPKNPIPLDASVDPNADPRDILVMTCAGPGDPHTFSWIRTTGARPKYCPAHRRTLANERSEAASVQRRRQTIVEEVKSASFTRDVGRISRLAACLRVFEDIQTAGRFAGLPETGLELEALVERAKREFPSVVSGDLRGTRHLAEAAIHAVLTEGFERRAEMSAKDLPQFGRFALQARQDLAGDGPTTNYVAIQLGIVSEPPSGQLTAEQRARVQGIEQARAAEDLDA